MATGPGKYDTLCTYVRVAARAEAAIVIVLNGSRGAGFSVQTTPRAAPYLGDLLEVVLKQIRSDEKASKRT